ncbi:hypothetical protein SAMN05444004_101463 [Jannaschia faecimaris]|uniref:Uncharacterized protein n=1 Tax=Jannaschia faecimaris TaxID=1244108 RepID=A0A1H3JZA5_9RHOB|nr:hypothetical protein [Jannaschia faecimaris]SDY44668.1 hypothetical protein SAMN05444004_101463 [Jannaschia faecimaris]
MIWHSKTLFALILVALLSDGAIAQQVEVQSGEHPNFSRLVFPDSPDRTWAVLELNGVTHIKFSRDMPSLDLSQVFKLIPRDRLRSATFENGTLSLVLGCACPVNITQIPSNHIVIDINDPLSEFSSNSNAHATELPFKFLPLRMPSFELQAPLLASLVESRGNQSSLIDGEIESSSVAQITSNQILKHPTGHVPLVLDEMLSERAIHQASNCEVDALARMVLTSDLGEALDDLTAAHASLLTGQDELDENAVHDLALVYLRLGWGAEAKRSIESSANDQEVIRIVAAALDGSSLPEYSSIDPGCGPGAAVVALLIGVEADVWARANEAELARFLDGIPEGRRREFGNRLSSSLTLLNQADLLIGITPTANTPMSEPKLSEAAAGTSAAAVLAAIDLLESANISSQPLDELHLENARAIRPSVPNGPMLDALDLVLAESLVIARQPAMAIEMVTDNQVSAQTLLDLLSAHLSPEDAADFMVRLEPLLSPDDPNRLRGRDFFLELGLPDTARRFADAPSGHLPFQVPTRLTDVDPWLTRDLSALADAPPESWSARNEIADVILKRNQSITLDTDLAIADQVLRQSREIGALARHLIQGP